MIRFLDIPATYLRPYYLGTDENGHPIEHMIRRKACICQKSRGPVGGLLRTMWRSDINRKRETK